MGVVLRTSPTARSQPQEVESGLGADRIKITNPNAMHSKRIVMINVGLRRNTNQNTP